MGLAKSPGMQLQTTCPLTHTPDFDRPASSSPLSLVLLSVDGHPGGVPEELLFEVLLFESDRRYRAWRQPGCVAVLRASDELDAVLWAGQVRERLHEHGLRISAGVATLTSPDVPAARMLDQAEWALERARHHGGDLVLAHSTTLAVNDLRHALRRSA